MAKRTWGGDGWYAARKNYSCGFCGKEIKKGTKYFRITPTVGDGLANMEVKSGAYCDESCAGQAAWRKK